MTCSAFTCLCKFLLSASKMSKAKYGSFNSAIPSNQSINPKQSIKKLEKMFHTFDYKILIHKTHIAVSVV